mmetsp:Transcript_11609/g.23723  ORF Transcript_11609/g.23723 Transcript_11609/m.23723 type:complete len:90 (+) Transcript_11609:128-397(+)
MEKLLIPTQNSRDQSIQICHPVVNAPSLLPNSGLFSGHQRVQWSHFIEHINKAFLKPVHPIIPKIVRCDEINIYNLLLYQPSCFFVFKV